MPDSLSQAATLADSLTKAEKLITEGMLEESDRVLQDCWLAHPEDLDVIALYARLMKESGRTQVSDKLDELLKLKRGLNDDRALDVQRAQELVAEESKSVALALFDCAYSLIDIRHFKLAVMLLEGCNRMQPNDPTVRYELGFSLMALGQIADAVPHFLNAYQEGQDFDTTLNLSVCYMLLRDHLRSRHYTDQLSEIATGPEEIKEAEHRRIALKRLEEFTAKTTLTKQDWLYILYGGIILSSKQPLGKEEHKSIAEIVLLLKGLLEGLRQEVELIEYYNVQARPLAKICSELMELPMDSYRGPNRPERCLLIMDWATDLIGPHEVFVDNKENRVIFAYAMSESEPLPLVPDIIGSFAEDPVMPWDNKTRDETFQSIGIKILDKARDLEADPDIIKFTQDLLSYYEPKRPNLVLGNAENFPERPEYSAEIQPA